MDELSKEKTRLSFEGDLDTLYAGRAGKPRWSRERIQDIMKLLDEHKRAAELNIVRNSTHYHYWRHYEVIEEDGEKVLITKRKQPTDPTVKIVASEEYFDVLSQVHDVTGHGGRDKMLTALKNNCLIPTPVLKIFLNHCGICKIKKANTLKNKTFTTAERRGLIDLIDKQDDPDENFKWILNYQDALTRFTFLRPLKSNSSSEIALELLKIFLEIGCPNALVNSNPEFTFAIISRLNKLWDVGITGVVPTIESDSKSIELLLKSWMEENNSTHWSLGLYFVQFQKNTTFDPIIDKTPYKALFGFDARNVDNYHTNIQVTEVKIEQPEIKIEIEEESNNS